MTKDSNDKSWPYQKFHDANKGKKINIQGGGSVINWKYKSYKYDNSGKIQEETYRYGTGPTSSPGSHLCNISLTYVRKNEVSHTFTKLEM